MKIEYYDYLLPGERPVDVIQFNIGEIRMFHRINYRTGKKLFSPGAWRIKWKIQENDLTTN